MLPDGIGMGGGGGGERVGKEDGIPICAMHLCVTEAVVLHIDSWIMRMIH